TCKAAGDGEARGASSRGPAASARYERSEPRSRELMAAQSRTKADMVSNEADDKGVPVPLTPVGATTGAPAELPPSSPAGRGMFGASGSGDTSGFGGLVRRRPVPTSAPRPFGSYFDDVYDALEEAFSGFDEAIERVVVDRNELTLHIRPERIADVCRTMRDDD